MIAKNTMNKELATNSVTSKYRHTTSSFFERPPVFVSVPSLLSSCEQNSELGASFLLHMIM
jgi:hypothetical protein